MGEQRSAYKPFFRRSNLLIPVLLLLGIAGALLVTSVNSAAREKNQTEQDLIGDAREQAHLLATRIDGQYELLETYSAYLAKLGQQEVAASIWRMGSLARHNSFSKLVFALPNGRVINSGADVSQYGYFQDALAGARATQVLRDGLFSDLTYIVLAVPVYRDGGVFGVVIGCYDGTGLEKLFLPESQDRAGYMLVVDAQGSVLAQRNDAFGRVYALGALTRRIDGGQDWNVKALLAQFDGKNKTTMEFTLDGEPHFAAILPVNQESVQRAGWKLIYGIEESAIAAQAAEATRDDFVLVLVLAGFFGVSFAFFIARDYKAYRAILHDAEQIRHENTRFGIIYDYTTISIWDYYFDTREIHRKEHTKNAENAEVVIADAPESLIRSGAVHPESAEAYLAMYRKLFAGAERAEGVFRMRSPDGAGYRYEHIRYKTLFDNNGRPYAAVGMAEDVTRQREQEMAYAKWRQSFEQMQPERYRMVEYNLTSNTFENDAGALFPFLAADAGGEAGFDARIHAIARLCNNPEDKAAVRAAFSREGLIAAYEAGNNNREMEFCVNGENGKTRWIRLNVQILPYPDSKDLKAYLLYQDIDEEKRRSLELIARSENDSLTGALNRGTLNKRVDELLSASHAGEAHAFMMIDMDNFKQINDSFGHAAGDRLLIGFAGDARALLRRDDLLGRIGGDEFAVCMRCTASHEVIAKKAESFCKLVAGVLGGPYGASVSLGIAVYPRDGATFEALYDNADRALYFTKEHGRNGYTFFGKEMRRFNGAEAGSPQAP